MLYVHAGSSIENAIYSNLSLIENVEQCQLISFNGKVSLKLIELQGAGNVLLYSFQQMDFYRHLEDFLQECKMVDQLVSFVLENKYEKIIILTYPGAYYNSNNLFLQHKGLIEQKFVNTGIPCTLLNVQGISDRGLHLNNLHSLFFDEAEQKYIIPQKSRCIVYTVQLNHLLEIIVKSLHEDYEGKHDVFDTIFDLKTYLLQYSETQSVQRISPLYLYFKSYLGQYASPTMLELFLMSIVPMYKFRTEKEFGISLAQEEHGLYFSYNRIHSGVSSQFNSLLKTIIPSG